MYEYSRKELAKLFSLPEKDVKLIQAEIIWEICRQARNCNLDQVCPEFADFLHKLFSEYCIGKNISANNLEKIKDYLKDNELMGKSPKDEEKLG